MMFETMFDWIPTVAVVNSEYYLHRTFTQTAAVISVFIACGLIVGTLVLFIRIASFHERMEKSEIRENALVAFLMVPVAAILLASGQYVAYIWGLFLAAVVLIAFYYACKGMVVAVLSFLRQ